MQERNGSVKRKYAKGRNYRIRWLASGKPQVEIRSTEYLGKGQSETISLPVGTTENEAHKHARHRLHELEHFSIRLGVARVCEISFAFVFGNPFEKRGDCFKAS